MSQYIQPPYFISDVKTYSEYKEDLKRWSRLTSLEKKLQAEMVVYFLDGHPSQIKEKIVTHFGDKLQADTGIKDLLEFLDSIYGKDDMSDVWDKYKSFSNHSRKAEEEISDFLPNWSMCYQKLKATGCDYSDAILGLKLLEDAQLSDIDTKLVLTGVDFKKAKEENNLLQQITNSLKKFTGQAFVSSKSSNPHRDVTVKTEPTFLVSKMEEVLVSSGWKPPSKKGSRRRSQSHSPPRRSNYNNYKGRKNPLDENRRPLKCYICECNHTEPCNCPCVYHLANNCPDRRSRASQPTHANSKPDLGLFVSTNVTPSFYTEDAVF